MIHRHEFILFKVFLMYLLIHTTSVMATEVTASESLSDNVDVDVKIYPAEGQHLIIWVAPDYGFKPGQYELAARLQGQAIETWMVDITESLFLPRGSRSMRQLTGKYVAELIASAHRKTTKKIILMSSFYGAIPVLRGARQWQTLFSGDSYLQGAILFSPALYETIPTLGENPKYLPIVDATNIPMMIFQGETNGFRWQIDTLLTHLHTAGSPAFTTIMPGISSLFYPDERNEAMQTYYTALPVKIRHAIKLFEHTVYPKTVLAKGNTISRNSSPDIELRAYTGSVTPTPIRLVDVMKKQYNLDNFEGKVTVLNFWATWCPPCVKEIPSLNALTKSIKHADFRVISVNYAETADVVQEFLKTFKVDFPVLLDRTGEIARDWRVIVFPSTYIIGPDGKIHYGVNAAIEWDSEKTIQQIKALLPFKGDQ